MTKHFTINEKIAAVKEYRESGRLRATARRLGIPATNIYRWNALFDSGRLYNGTDACSRIAAVLPACP